MVAKFYIIMKLRLSQRMISPTQLATALSGNILEPVKNTSKCSAYNVDYQ